MGEEFGWLRIHVAVVVGDVLGPPVQGPAHAPDQDLGAEVEHDPGPVVDVVVAVGAGATAVVGQSLVVVPSPNQLRAPNHDHVPSQNQKRVLRSRNLSTNNRLPTVRKHNSYHHLVNAPSLNPDPSHVQGPDLNPRTTDLSPDPNLSPRQNRDPRIDLAQGLLARVKASPSPGAVPQRRMVVISHLMTRNMTELCCIYVLCILGLLWKLPQQATMFLLSLVM